MKIGDIIYHFEKWAAILLLAFTVTLSFIQVILRYFFNSGFAWVPEIVVFTFITMTLLATSTGIRNGVHIGVDVIVKLLPPKFQKVSEIFTSFSGAALMLFTSYLTYKFVLYFREMGQLSIITEIPIWMMIAYMPVAFLFMAIHYGELLWKSFLKGDEPDEEMMKRKRERI